MHDGVCSSGLSITWLTSGTQTVITLNTAYEETFLFYTTDERDTADCLCLSKTLIWLTMNVFDFCFVSLSTFSRQCVKEWHSGPIPQKFSFDECRMAPSGCRPKTKPDDLGCESACTGCQNLHPPSPFIIITQPESWYSFYRPTEGRRLSWPSLLVTYRNGLPVHRRSPIRVLTASDVEQLRWSTPTRYH